MQARPYTSFFKRLPLTFIAAMFVWMIIQPGLDRGITGLSEVLLRSFEHPRVTRLVPADHRVEVRRTDFRTDSKIPTVPLIENNFNTIVLLALFFALPRPFSRRQLERLFMGWCILCFTQTINLVLHVKCIYAMSLGAWSLQEYSDFARNFYGFWRYFTDLPGRFSFPFIIWLSFNWNFVNGLIDHQQPEQNPKSKNRGKKK